MRLGIPSLNFMAARNVAALASILAVIVSIVLLATNGLSFGLDFTGGSLVELEFAQEPTLEVVREVLVNAGFVDAVVQAFGTPTDVIVRLAQDDAPKAGDQVFAVLQLSLIHISEPTRPY